MLFKYWPLYSPIHVSRHVWSVVPDHLLCGDVVGPLLALSPLLDGQLALWSIEALTAHYIYKAMHTS